MNLLIFQQSIWSLQDSSSNLLELDMYNVKVSNISLLCLSGIQYQ